VQKVPSNIGDRIRELREQKGWSQRELSRRVGINYSVMSRIESGQRPVEDDEILKFADIFEVSTDYLLGRSNDPSPVIEVAGKEIKLTPDEFKVFEEIKKHPILFHDLVSDPEKKVRQLIKMWRFIKEDLERDDVEIGEGFGEIED
jgi:transcriptional regulator with XRE-family HTH domain